MTRKRLAAFGDAWSRGDVAELLEFFAPDGVYATSIGPGPGSEYRGSNALAEGLREILDYERETSAGLSPPPPPLAPNPMFLHGHRAFCEWSYPQRAGDGRIVLVRGCDFFEFDGRQIRRKDAFIKRFHRDGLNE